MLVKSFSIHYTIDKAADANTNEYICKHCLSLYFVRKPWLFCHVTPLIKFLNVLGFGLACAKFFVLVAWCAKNFLNGRNFLKSTREL